MHSHKKGRLVTAWIAIIAILMGMLAPSMSFAFEPHAHASPWTEICSAKTADHAVPALVELANDEHDGHQKNIFHLKHCPFCFKQDRAGLPFATTALSVPPATGGSVHAMLFYQASTPLQVWSAKNPRAPPAA